MTSEIRLNVRLGFLTTLVTRLKRFIAVDAVVVVAVVVVVVVERETVLHFSLLLWKSAIKMDFVD